jgi:photosystem II stability/assembly factor-like uncharacterized protein
MRILAARCALALVLTAVAVRAESAPPTLRRIGPEGGSIETLARAPLKDAPLFAVSSGGELFRFGADDRWTPVAEQISVVVPDPTDARIVYALPPYGRLRVSRDGGTTWSTDTGLNVEHAGSLVIVPSSGSAFVATSAAVFRSRDGMRSWSAVLSRVDDGDDATFQLLLGTNPSPIIYAYLPGEVLLRSEDDGETWLPAALPPGTCDRYSDDCTAIRVDPRDARRLLVGVGSGIQISADGGETWTAAPIAEDDEWWFDDTILAIAIDPNDPQRAYAVRDSGLLTSSDAGAEWEAAGQIVSGIEDLLVDPTDTQTLYGFGGQEYSSGSIGVQVSHDGGRTWEAMNRGLNATCIATLTAVSPESFFSGTCDSDGTLMLTTDAGQTWRSVRQGLPEQTRVEAVAVVGGDDLDIIYAGLSRGGIYRSMDGGAHWLPTNVGDWSIRDLALSAGSSPLLYAAVWPAGIWSSSDGGARWDRADGDLLTHDPGQVESIVADPLDPRRAYTIVSYYDGPTPLFQTLDGGQHWSALGGAALPRHVDEVTISAADPFQLYVAGPQAVYASGDRGASWYRTGFPETSPGVIKLAADPIWPGTVYATSNGRVLRSDDRGDTWQVLVTATDYRGASQLVAVGEPHTLLMPTYNQGILAYGPLPAPNPQPPCGGDCNGDRAISIAELVTSVNIALGFDSPSLCPSADSDDNDDVSIAELISAVAAALSGCA